MPSPTADTRTARPNYLLHAVLFALTCFTTYFVGSGGFKNHADGIEFAGTLMAILLTHEMGHYVVARRHGVDASLPYFIPIPFAMGTLGAVIRMRSPIERRDALMDVGAAGPLAGLAVAIPLLILGLQASPVIQPAVEYAGQASFIEGNSLLYIALKLVVKGQYLPHDGWDVMLSPMAMAAWVGLLITFINLMPIGQLDGGHVAYAFFGEEHETRSPWIHRGLLVVGLGVFVALFVEAVRAGLEMGPAVEYGVSSALPWLVWALLLLGMKRLSGGRYHPPVGPEPLSESRKILFWIVVAVFVLLFTPVPLRGAL